MKKLKMQSFFLLSSPETVVKQFIIEFARKIASQQSVEKSETAE